MTDQMHLLDAPVVPESGIKNPNFFNGRVLTATDLQDEQAANRRQHQQLGRAAGAGVVVGLEVSLTTAGVGNTTPVLEVSRGLALNRRGQAVELVSARTRVTLARKLPAAARSDAVFADCEPLRLGPDLVGRGVYIFAVAPASAYRERAPMVPVGGGGRASGCGDRYAVEGVVFRLVELPLDTLRASEDDRDIIAGLMSDSERSSLAPLARAAARSKLRNLLAHTCFGTESLAGFLRDPLRRVGGRSPLLRYGVEDALEDAGLLSDCDVPLALIFWTQGGVRFVDMWAVRRRLIAAAPLGSAWPLPLEPRRQSEAEAMFQQFQDQLAALVTDQGLSVANLNVLHARDFFRFLPPAGIVPIATGTQRGFFYQNFWHNVTHREPVFIEGARLEHALREALSYPPQDLDAAELTWLYMLRQNIQARDTGAPGPPQPVVIFTSGQLPFHGEAQYNLARWSYSNYGPGVGGLIVGGG